MAKAPASSRMVMNTRENCVMVFSMEKAHSDGLIPQFTKENLKKTKLQARDLITGLTEAHIRVK